MKKYFKPLALVLVVIMAAGLFSGCKIREKAPSPTDPTSSNPASDPNGGSEPQGNSFEKVLIYGLSGFDSKFMPIMADNSYNIQFCNLLFDSLIDVNSSGEYVPELATWTLSDDHLTYTFTLKDGIKFSDGTPLTADDVAFTYELMGLPDYVGPRSYAVDQLMGYSEFHSGSTDSLEGIKVLNDKQISFTFKDGMASPANTECFTYGIMSRAYYEAPTFEAVLEKMAAPIGAGPFVLAEYRPKELVRLEKDPNYWNIAVNETRLDGILGIDIAKENIISALQARKIDLGEVGANMDNLDAMKAVAHINPYIFLANGFTYMCFNCTNGIFNDVRVRQAFMYSLDRKAFIQAEYGEMASLGLTPISPLSWAFPDLSELNTYDYDEAKASQLLDEAGWIMGSDGFRYKDDRKLSVRWLVYTDSEWPSTISGMAADTWKKQGIELKIELMDFNTVIAKTMFAPVGEKDFDIYTMGLDLNVDPDPRGALFDGDAYTEGGYNASGWYDERSQELMHFGRTEYDQAKRAEYYKEWGIIQNEQIPTALIAYRNSLWGATDRVAGLKISAYCDWTYSIYDIDITHAN